MNQPRKQVAVVTGASRGVGQGIALALGAAGMTVFVSVKIEGHASEDADDFVAAVSAMPEVITFHLVSGETDYFLEVVVADLAHYQRFLLDRLLGMPIVREVKSNIVIQAHKASAPMPLDHLD